ncbi:MAG: IclR family transcriptional regulator [Kiloniellaceae bacterium]
MKVSQVENALALFELFAKEKAPRTLTALAEQLGIPKSSTFNLIHTLLDHGYIYETRRRGGYYPTRRLLDLAYRIAEGDPFLQGIHGFLEALAAETGETVLLSVRERGEVIYVDVMESSSPIRYSAKVGDRRPLCTASSGMAILASFAADERADVIASLDLTAAPGRAGWTAESLAAELDASVERGWCEDWARTAPDVMGVGVPLVCGERRFGLAVAGPIYRMQDRRGELAAALLAAAGEIRRLFEENVAPPATARQPGARQSSSRKPNP